MKQQGARVRTSVRALGLAIALTLPGVLMAAEPAATTAAPDVASAPGMSMVTFNLHHDREDWPSRRRTILAELKRLQPDAVALQEVIQRRNVRNQAQWLASQLGYRYVFVSTDPVGAPKRYGNALLTRRPILAQGIICCSRWTTTARLLTCASTSMARR